MDIARTPAIERIARVLAGRELSANASGAELSAADSVDATWPAHRDDAIAILKTLREPDQRMAEAGDAGTWARMVAAALGDASVTTIAQSAEEPIEIGAAPFLEGP
jgi:hypothetical protein